MRVDLIRLAAPDHKIHKPFCGLLLPAYRWYAVMLASQIPLRKDGILIKVDDILALCSLLIVLTIWPEAQYAFTAPWWLISEFSAPLILSIKKKKSVINQFLELSDDVNNVYL